MTERDDFCLSNNRESERRFIILLKRLLEYCELLQTLVFQQMIYPLHSVDERSPPCIAHIERD